MNRLLTKAAVAKRLHICERSLSTYGSRYRVYKADSPGVYHIEHVRILEKVRARILTPEEGDTLWQYQKMRIRRRALEPMKGAKRQIG